MTWFCLHTRPAKECQVARYCEDVLSVETYFPRLRSRQVTRQGRREVTRPLFPRYLFSRFDLASHYRAIRYAPDVIELVSFGGRPAVVDSDVIGSLRQWAGERLDLIELQLGLRSGDQVRITSGPFQGLEAIVQHPTRDPDRVAVLLSILSCGPRLTIDRSLVELVA